jgi:hypothetical protein
MATVDFKNVTLNWEHASIASSLELIGYNIFRNDTLLTETIHTELSFIDINVPAGSHEYKVQSVFIGEGNGPFTSTEAYISLISNQFTTAISVFPNPASDIINIQFQNKNADELNCSLLDLNGRLVTSKALRMGFEGIVKIELPVVNRGIYILKVSDGSASFSKKILIDPNN